MCRGSSPFFRLGFFEDEHECEKEKTARGTVERGGRERGHNAVSQIRHGCMLRGEVWQVVDARLRIQSMGGRISCVGRGWRLTTDSSLGR